MKSAAGLRYDPSEGVHAACIVQIANEIFASVGNRYQE
jgi:hypothetical protein